MLTKILLFSGGSDSVLIYHLYKPDYLVYVNLHTRYSEEEIRKIDPKESFLSAKLDIKIYNNIKKYIKKLLYN